MPGGHFTVLRGNPTPEELAAAVTVLLSLAATARTVVRPVSRTTRPHWHSRRRITHARGRHLPAAAWTGVGGGPWPGAGR
ncbi:conserved hypothetical protein [Catenulispora acidiphila DSM 44928]|uniref:Acyl-CoA carboxylase epsilon subunit-like protein n=1 Tax=Catenulispora acidiphila (strain DSM 44928 / JCM 14897 / NBRC 102108 / NRRL B-24433 / ID139908) TaxID=479433 RepID=C7PY61_CATAD|nr:acyl-CoA carboxylase subunit epsilon [Catenulispora acidiphila]ACU75351.1 conserved hypothetical protein [Catenulispora acidiphila DSM 44928]